MRKFILLFLQFLIFQSAFAQDVIKYTSVNLKMRQDTTSTSKVITVIPQGTAVTMEECDCEWIPVAYQGKVGYVYSKYLTKTHPVNISTTISKKYYTNSAGQRIQSPTHYNSVPEGATALCRDGTYSFSASRRGTCSHHGGVEKWL